VVRIVPEADRRFGQTVFISERAQTGCAQQEVARALHGQPYPSRGQSPQEMPAGEDEDGAFDSTDPLDDAIRSRAQFLEGLAAGESVAEDLPIRAFGLDLRARESLVFPVVPFHEVRVDFGSLSEAGELARARRALQRAGEDPAEFEALETLAQAPGVALPALRQRQIGAAGMLPAQRPGGFAMTCKVDGLKSVQRSVPQMNYLFNR